MKSLITFLMGLLCLSLTLQAQETFNVSELFAQNEFSTNSDNDLLFVCRNTTDTSPEAEKWKKGVLIDYEDKAHQVKSHYNIATDEIQILLQNQSKTVLPQKIKAIKVGEMVFVPCEFEGEEVQTYGYFQVLSGPKINLLKRFETQNGLVKKSFYYRKKDEPAKFLKLNKKCLLKVLDNNKTNKYLKSKQLNIKEEEDLIELFNYHNSTKS